MIEGEAITIIEGPTPNFELPDELWANGLVEGSQKLNLFKTRIFSHNAPALVERYYQAWSKKLPIDLNFNDYLGMPQKAKILAANSIEIPDGYILLLWVNLETSLIQELDEQMRNNDPDDDGLSAFGCI